jgi:hypothetical protein
MKKITLVVAMLFAFCTLSSFASEEPVDRRVLRAFKINFEGATDVSWTIGSNYYEAVFTLHNQVLYAFYGLDSEFIAVTHYISPSALPLRLQTNLKKMIGTYWITNLFEATNDAGTMYYVTFENADSKMVLESRSAGNWAVIQKDKKD